MALRNHTFGIDVKADREFRKEMQVARAQMIASLMEIQQYRCATCHNDIEVSTAYDCPDATRLACLIGVDPNQPKIFQNCVMLCAVCAGEANGRFGGPMQLYEAIQRGEAFVRREKVHVANPDTIARIQEILVSKGYPPFERFPTSIATAPIDRAEHIAEITMARYDREKTAKLPIARSSRFPADKRRLSEAQNHRCAYCGVRMGDEPQTSNHVTYEHVVELRNGGADTMRNLVAACYFCNVLREHMKLTALDFYKWVVAHPGDRRRKEIEWEHNRRIRRRQHSQPKVQRAAQ